MLLKEPSLFRVQAWMQNKTLQERTCKFEEAHGMKSELETGTKMIIMPQTT